MGAARPHSPFRQVREAAQRSLAPALIALIALLWTAVASVAAAFLYEAREAALQRATERAEGLAQVLEAHIVRTYQAVDITLAAVAGTLRLAETGIEDDNLRQMLIERLQGLQPYGRALFVADADGRVMHDTWYLTLQGASLADRDYFRGHLQDPALKSAIWPPVVSRADGAWSLPITRAIAEGGPFQGIVAATIEPHYFQAIFSRLGMERADVTALYYRDGTLIARHPYDQRMVGTSFADAAVFSTHLPRAATGSYVTESGMFSYGRLVSYRSLEGMPMAVVISQSTRSILRAWRQTAAAAAVALAGLAVLLGVIVALLLRQQRIRELGRMRTVQSEKLEALGHLTGGISHDFANLLNVVSISLRTIALEPHHAGRVRDAAAVAERALVGGARLLEQLQTFARRQPMHVQPANLNVLVDSAIELLRHVTGRDMKLRADFAPAVAPCLLDETELEVALVNLLVNAKDAGARKVVLKTFEYGAGHVGLSVADDGAGMPEEVRRRAFEPYFSTKGTEGTGLGLAQVYGFMRQIGGDVHIESRPGRGTTVYLLFPRAPVPAPATQAQGA